MCKHLLKIQRLILALLIFGGGIFYTSSATARVCFLPDSTDCGEGDVDVPEVQITCATYGGYETEAACLEARTNKTAQTCTLNSGCYYPKCAYDSERKCKNENPDKNCLSQTVDGVKCWYSQLKTCFDQGYKSACSSDENSTPVNIEAFDGPCYKCTEKATCKQMKPGVYYGPNDTCPKYTDRKDAGVSARDGKCSTCEPQACSAINTAYKSEAKKDTCGSNKEAKKVEGTDSAADGPCYTCVDKGDGNYDYIIYIDDTQSQENDEVTISRSVYSTDRNATFDAESAADVTEERCNWDCNCNEGGTSISLANGKTATYWDFNIEPGGGSSGACDYIRTYVSWNYTKVTVNGTTKEYKNTQCKDGTITDSKGTVYKIVCGIPTCSDIGYQTTPCSTGYKQIDSIQLPHENCYKCEKAQTCSEIDKTYIETSSIQDNDPEDICPYLYSPVFGYVKNLGNGNTDLKIGFKFGGGDNAEFVDTSVVGCTACRWKTCEEIDSDFGNSSLDCLPGYDATPLSYNWAVGSDGRCYECVKQKTIIEFEYYVPSVDGAGDYCEDGLNWSGPDGNFHWNSSYMCPTPECVEEHKAEWEAGLYASEYAYDFNYNDFVLPFDMEIVTKYKVPYVYRGIDCRDKPITSWPPEYVDPIYEPKTVTLTIPKGSKLNSQFKAKALDYSGNDAVIERKFYIDGVERETYTIGDITYQFQEI